jgi:hypothetical protein
MRLAQVTAVPVVMAMDLGSLQDPDTKVELWNEVVSNRHNESHLEKIQQYVGTKYIEETGQGKDSGSTKPYDKEVCLAECPLGLW